MSMVQFAVLLACVSAISKSIDGADSDRVESLPGLNESVGVQFAGYASTSSSQGEPTSGNQSREELFYWFVGAKDADYTIRPTILWTNGGPGASSFWGFFLENGPYKVTGSKDKPVLKPRRDAWSNSANYLIFEHPLGVTLSYPRSEKKLPHNVTAGISQLYHALLNFGAKHPEIAATPLILAGESYAGTYVPLLAQAIMHGHRCAGCPALNLRSIVLVDAWVNPPVQMASDTTYAMSHGLISIEQKRELDQKYAGDLPGLRDAIANLSGIYMLNFARRRDPPVKPVLDYLNREDVRRAIHAKQNAPLTQLSSDEISTLYSKGVNDSYQQIVQALLDAGLPIVVISGLNDASDCNFLGTARWLDLLQGPTADKFRTAKPNIWKAPKSHGALGYIQDSGGSELTWIKVLNAGHLAVFDQPLLIDLVLHKADQTLFI